MISDPIADLLTRIRNANLRNKKEVRIPYSNLKHRIINILLEEGYILNYKVIDSVKFGSDVLIYLKYKGRNSTITQLKRISKPNRRVYLGYEDIPNVLNGYGISIISTSKGLMTGEKAKISKLGGEVLAYIW